MGCTACHRGEYALPQLGGGQVVPVSEDGVGDAGGGQAAIGRARHSPSPEGQGAVGTGAYLAEALVVQGEGERDSHGGGAIVTVVACVGGACHYCGGGVREHHIV